MTTRDTAAIITFNCARELVDPERFAANVAHNVQWQRLPVFIFLSLQEVAPIAHSFLGGSFLNPYLAQFGKAIRTAAKVWQESNGNLDSGATAQSSESSAEEPIYVPVEAQNVGMTAGILFVRNEHVDRVKWVETAGTGVGYMDTGNKGCVGIRIGYAASSKTVVPLTFLAAHLAPGEGKREQRNADWQRIVEDVVFVRKQSKVVKSKDGRAARSEGDGESEPLLRRKDEESSNQGIYGSRSLVFFAGDLNYRTSDVVPTEADAATFPQPESLDDYESFKKLFSTDQLTQEHRAARVLQGFNEPPISFPPTYKYAQSARTAALQSDDAIYAESKHSVWAKRRWPSWCDRVWILDEAGAISKKASITAAGSQYRSLPLLPSSDHQPVALCCDFSLDAIAAVVETEQAPVLAAPYSIKADWRARRGTARRLELAFGLTAYFGWTWEGNALVMATLVGAWGGWTLIHLIL